MFRFEPSIAEQHAPRESARLRPTPVSYRFVDHTAEMQLELESGTQAGILEDAVLALAELLGGEDAPAGPPASREVEVTAEDDASLLAAWVDEIVFIAETDGLVPRRVERITVEPSGVRAVVSFVETAPFHLVKGATYHDLALAQERDVWRGRVVLDV